jgi:NADH-quinone oxidoreductase subunit N
MTEPSMLEHVTAAGLLGGGLLLLVAATVWALRPPRPARGEKAPDAQGAASRAFTWVVIAGISYSLLGLAAAVREPASAGVTGALLQLVAVLLSAGLGAAALGGRDVGGSAGRSLGSAGFTVAWLSLLGLPPAVGFHAKVLVYRSLLLAGWQWAAAAAMAASAAALVPALFAASHYRPAGARGLRALWIILLLAAVVILGVYPQAGIGVVAPAASLAVRP